MIKIHKRLWTVTTTSKHKEPGLAYMTYADKEDAAFEKRQSTGRGWAKGYPRDKDRTGEENFHDNTPVKGFEVIGCVSRWSTSNKLFQIRDPRGFVVEIPSGNLGTLLQMTTVVNGVIEEECVWGREGNNHILLPVGSEPYNQSLADTQTANEMVTLAKLEPGDVVRMSVGDTTEWVYFGRVKLTWKYKLRQKKRAKDYNWYNQWEKQSPTDEVVKEVDAKDHKWDFLFKKIGSDGHFILKSSGKCVKTGVKSKALRPTKVDVWMPDRVCSKNNLYRVYGYHGQGEGQYSETEVIDIEWRT